MKKILKFNYQQLNNYVAVITNMTIVMKLGINLQWKYLINKKILYFILDS